MHVKTVSTGRYTAALPPLYARLKRIAGRQLSGGRAPATLSATVLVHEAYLRVAGGGGLEAYEETHLISLLARSMRQVLIDYCRAKASSKRRGVQVDIDEVEIGEAADPEALLVLEDSLRALEAHEPRLARVLELRVLAGLDSAQIADHLGVDQRTVQRDWVRARQWLSGS